MTVEEMLNQLGEFHAQADLLELRKAELLNSVKIPAEVQQIHDEGMKRKQALDQDYNNQLLILDAEKQEMLKTVVVPPEIRAAFERIETKRREIEAEAERKKREAYAANQDRKAKVDAEFSAQVAGVYAEVNTRKQEINLEFAGQTEVVEKNIADLTATIKKQPIEETTRGKTWMAVHVKGRVTWNTDMLDGMIIVFPELGKARKEGPPTITLRRI
jgi:hypothetical protein